MRMWHDTSWMWLAMVVFWGLVAWIVYAAFASRRDDAPTGSPPSASEVLDRRYASGELSSEDYRERRDVLAHAHPAPDREPAGAGDRP